MGFGTYLRFDQDQINEQNYKVMFDVLVTESAAVFANCEADAVAT